MRKEEKYDYKPIAIVMIIVIILMYFMVHKPNYPDVRAMNGIDTLVTEDSFYPIHFSIDTAIEIEKDYEPPERN